MSDVHAIVYRADPLSSNSMKSNNPYSGFHKIEVSPCLDCTIPEPSKNQGGYRDATVLALDGDKWKPRNTYRQRQGGNGFGINADGASYTLNTVDRHIVAILNFKH